MCVPRRSNDLGYQPLCPNYRFSPPSHELPTLSCSLHCRRNAINFIQVVRLEEPLHACKRCGSQMCDLVRCAGCWPVSQIWEQSGAERPNLLCAEVAQLAEHSPEKAGVDSSILSLGTIFRILRDSDSLASGTQVAVTGT